MSEITNPEQIVIITRAPEAATGGDHRRGESAPPHLPTLETVHVTSLQSQVTIFLQQLDQVIQETPEQVGGFRLEEFEVSAGIVVEGKGGVRLGLIAEASGGVNASFHFVFKRG
ncbi:MAG: hypothetical protein MI924_35330 [Chloroflexales bacterium]|nr:hypothetical protein [Chloroflexales bacterium]